MEKRELFFPDIRSRRKKGGKEAFHARENRKKKKKLICVRRNTCLSVGGGVLGGGGGKGGGAGGGGGSDVWGEGSGGGGGGGGGVGRGGGGAVARRVQRMRDLPGTGMLRGTEDRSKKPEITRERTISERDRENGLLKMKGAKRLGSDCSYRLGRGRRQQEGNVGSKRAARGGLADSAPPNIAARRSRRGREGRSCPLDRGGEKEENYFEETRGSVEIEYENRSGPARKRKSTRPGGSAVP